MEGKGEATIQRTRTEGTFADLAISKSGIDSFALCNTGVSVKGSIVPSTYRHPNIWYSETVSAMSQILSRNVTALKSVKDDSAALQKTYAPSIVSSSVGTVFDFDNEVINSSAYRRAFHSFSAAQADRSIDVSDHSSEDDDVALPDPNIREEQPSSRNNAEPKEERRESPVNASTAVTLLPIKFTEKLQLTSLGIMVNAVVPCGNVKMRC